MHTIIGVKETKFTGKDGNLVTGNTLYLTFPLNSKLGQGLACESIFMSTSKISQLEFKPAPGMVVEVLFNRFGKVQTLNLLDDIDFGTK